MGVKTKDREVTKEWGSFIEGLRYEDIPHEVIEQAKLCILDLIGTIVRGSQLPQSKIVANYIKKQGGTPSSSVLMNAYKTGAFHAAYVNGTMGSSIELDDGHIKAHTHPGVVVIPAVFALAEREKFSGKEILTAIILGYDLNIRLGIAINGPEKGSMYARAFSSSAVTGSFSSAAACSKLLGLSGDMIVNALGNANLGPAATTGGVSQSGGTLKNSFYGWPSAVGLFAAELAENGITGDPAIFEGPRSFCQAISDDYSLDILVEGLGTHWHIMDIYRKRHAMCSHGHAILDGILDLLEEYKFWPDDIDEVNIKSYKFVSMMDAKKPSTIPHAMFSMPFTAASTMINKRPLSVDDTESTNLNNPSILALSDKINVIFDESLDTEHNTNPGRRPSIIEVSLKDGQKLSKKVYSAKGWQHDPLSHHEVEEKFELLVNNYLTKEKISSIKETVKSFEELETVDELLKNCST